MTIEFILHLPSSAMSLSCAVLVCMFSMFIIGIYVNPETGTRQSGVSGVGISSNIANILIILPKVSNLFLILPKQPCLLQIFSLTNPNNPFCYKYLPLCTQTFLSVTNIFLILSKQF